VYVADTSTTAGLRRPDARHLVLRQTLSIALAGTENQLVVRTLAAACEIAGGAVAAAIGADLSRRLHGDERLTARLARADDGTLQRMRGQPAGHTDALTAVGLPSAVTDFAGDSLVLVAVGEPHRLDSEAASLLALVVAHAQAGLRRLHEVAQLQLCADSDPLTGLRHHRPFYRGLAACRPGQTAILAIDVDCFKKVNDEHGHPAGDRALIRLAEALHDALREGDQLYRIGGDEFAVIIDVATPVEATAVASRLVDAARRVGHTISVGTALHTRGETGTQLLARADKALYEAKRAGRDTARLAA
jgi:diguanylate cyclase (GGDEF)-like protein